MTDQPTTWTPERALAMLRDWRDAKSYSSFSSKWGNPDRGRVAFEAIEYAAAEIERQKARADAAEKEAAMIRDGTKLVREGLMAETERLRAQVAERDCAATDLVDERDEAKARADRAERALRSAGWQDLGGAEWKPPLGEPPQFIEVLPKGVADEVDRLRACLVRCGRAVGGKMADDVSLEFLGYVPAEVERVVKRLRAELAAMTQQRDVYCKEMLDAMKATKPAAQEGPSDEEIAVAIDNAYHHSEVRAALRLVARRAGVKL